MDESIESVLPQHGKAHSLKLQFTGSGSEYFRIWIVNLLLTLVTLGIYFPWAKVRRLRYFYGNTLVGGEPLGFHGDPKKMFKGYALMALFFICYSIAGNFSPVAGLVALLTATALWPALMKASLQFRLANTSWRGLRFHFAGDLAGAYRAALPGFVPWVLIVCLTATHPTDAGAVIPGWVTKSVALGGLVALLLSPWFFWLLKKYQHDNYALGSQRTDFQAGTGSFYKLGLKVFSSYVVFAAVIPMVLLIGALGLGIRHTDSPEDNVKTAKYIGMLMLLILPLSIAAYAFAVARFQDLVWNHTASADIRFTSRLRFRSLYWLTLKNLLLMAVTLGLYWPFAAIGIQRLRVEAVSLEIDLAPEQLVSDAMEHAQDASGVAAGDFFGFDIGL